MRFISSSLERLIQGTLVKGKLRGKQAADLHVANDLHTHWVSFTKQPINSLLESDTLQSLEW